MSNECSERNVETKICCCDDDKGMIIRCIDELNVMMKGGMMMIEV